MAIITSKDFQSMRELLLELEKAQTITSEQLIQTTEIFADCLETLIVQNNIIASLRLKNEQQSKVIAEIFSATSRAIDSNFFTS